MASTTRSRPDGTIRRRGDGWQASLFTGYDPLTGCRSYGQSLTVRAARPSSPSLARPCVTACGDTIALPGAR